MNGSQGSDRGEKLQAGRRKSPDERPHIPLKWNLVCVKDVSDDSSWAAIKANVGHHHTMPSLRRNLKTSRQFI